jgi:hypothetical protein
MLQLLQPFWLFSLLGLIVPVAIHLWNRKQGRRIRVGSIALLKEAQSRRMSSIRLGELWLLLVRCGLLGLLALLLAGPQWVRPGEVKVKNRILVSPELAEQMADSASLVRQAVDSLTTAETELHWFSEGFPAIEDGKLLVNQNSTDEPENYWSLLREATQVLPDRAEVFLLTGERLASLKGERPVTSFRVNWLTFPDADTTSTWIQETYFTGTDSLRVVWGESQPTGNQLRISTLPARMGSFPQPAGQTLHLTTANGAASVRLNGGNAAPVDTAITRINLYYDTRYSSDVGYLQTALQAISRFTGRNMVVTTTSGPDKIPFPEGMIFWLSHAPFPENDAPKTRVLFRYPLSDSTQNISTWLEWPIVSARPVRVFRQFTGKISGVPVWRNGFGEPLLSRDDKGSPATYCFNSRFSPQWNDLAWSPAFPEALLSLLRTSLWEPRSKPTRFTDLRGVDARQLLPRSGGGKTDSTPDADIVPLREPLLLAALLLFALERWLSHRQKTETPKRVTA